MAKLQFTKQSYIKLHDAYKLACSKGETEFEHNGQTWLVSYAKYVLEYFKYLVDTEVKDTDC